MGKYLFILMTACLVCATPATAAPENSLPARPGSAIIYPGKALITVRETVDAGAASFVVTLPGEAESGTLSIQIQGNAVSSLVWDEPEEAQMSGQESQLRQSLRADLEKLRLEQAGLLGESKALQASVSFWENARPDKIATADEMEKLDAAMLRHLPEAQKALPDLQRKLERIQERINETEKRLRQIGPERLYVRRARVFLNAVPSAPLPIVYTYMLRGCGWSPAYRFEARPDAGLVVFRQEAEVWQRSGFDWSATEISVATIAPSSKLAPQPLPEWRISSPVVLLPAPAARMRAAAMPESSEEVSMPDAKKPMEAPQQALMREMSTFQQWDLGKRSLPSGERLRLTLVRDEEWKGVFRYILRPGVQDKAFLGVEAKLPLPRELPRGQAVYALDGRVVGSAVFAYSGDEPELFFGPDALVSSSARLVKRIGGEKGLINKERSEIWEWEIKVVNGHSFPVNLRVEDPLPKPSDEAIRVQIRSEPVPETEKDSIYVWKNELKAKGEMLIKHFVEVKAPADMPFIPGR
ncbi:MAG: DUF4139 domain-containing protein [Desulfovibrio sp.]|jgi:uncharacterized protein (TIGR02231 family)|nr:DUF4139 domain-containing protein [Desulfovibrio sp.]